MMTSRKEDKQFMLSVQRTIRFVDGHYCIGFPLRDEAVKMPNNHCTAEQRAASLKRELQTNEVFLEDYKAFMESIPEKGYAVEVPPEHLDCNDSRVCTTGCTTQTKRKFAWSLSARPSFSGCVAEWRVTAGA